MSGKNSRLNALAARKQLLIAASELDRAKLVEELQILADEARALANQGRAITSLISAIASLATGFRRFQDKKPAAESKPSWWQTILKGAGLFSTLWQGFHPPGRD